MKTLFGRKRTSELAGKVSRIDQQKNDELLALKLKTIHQEAQTSGALLDLPLEMIRPDDNQPRKVFNHLDSLAASIQQNGVIQPVIVTPKNNQGFYTIIAGERRYRAASKLKLPTIPCIIRDADDANIVILQLLENDQREDVTPLEESDALHKLVHDLKMNKIDVAKQLGHDPAWVSIRLGLQKASDQVKSLVKKGMVEDIRTLHDLRMFELESPEKAKQLIQKIVQNKVSGSYRQVVSSARVNARKQQPSQRLETMPTIRAIELDKGLLVLDVGTKTPIKFNCDADVIKAFRELLDHK